MPKTVGDYELGKKLGEGGYSVVREATNTKNGKKYAIKIVDRRQFNGPEYEKKFEREISIMNKLDHPGIVK